MSRTILAILPSFLLCLGLPALAVAGMPTWEQHTTKNKPRKHVMVQFTDFSLHPSVAQLLEGGTVSWVNYATTSAGTIFFSDEAAKGFTCTELRPSWMKVADGYQSIPITQAGAANDLEIPCPLKPGEYEYEIRLFVPQIGGEMSGMGDPHSQMQGKIVVE